MPPRKKQVQSVSGSSNETAIASFPVPPTMVPTKQDDGHRTPERSPAKKALGITQAQKQALVDNLQLEITERARKLRAQYALQAQSLRSRLEMRVNRIPPALRKRNIQELIDEHATKSNPKPAAPLPAAPKQAEKAAPPSARKSLKRTSEHFADDDKENAPAEPYAHDLANPKKRTKTATAQANTKATRTASNKAPPTVLSPRSANSRTLPRSPLKHTSPEKPAFTTARPASPVKPLVTQTSAMSSKPSSRAPSRQTKRPAPARAAALNTEGRDSESSTTSAGTTSTTVVTKEVAKKAPATRKAAPAKTTAAATKKIAAAKKEAAPAPIPPAGGRTLRKRG